MPEPRSEWGKEVVERVEQLATKVDSLTAEVQKVDGVMTELKQLSADGRALSATVVRLDDHLGNAVKSLDQLTQKIEGFAAKLEGFAEFKTTGENIIGWIKWFFAGSLAAGIALIFAMINGVGTVSEIRSSVKLQGERIDKLEVATVKLQESTAKLQEATSSNATAARTLAENVEKNTGATKQLAAELRNELKSLPPVKVELAKTHEVTARFFLSQGAIQKKHKESIEFRWKLPHSIEKDKVEKTKATARLAPLAAFEPSTGFTNADVQLRAGLTPDGQCCWLEIFSPRAPQLADSLKGAVKVPVDVTFMLPD